MDASLIRYVYYCMKNVRIRSYSGPHFPAFGLNIHITENADQNNSQYGHFLRSVFLLLILENLWKV